MIGISYSVIAKEVLAGRYIKNVVQNLDIKVRDAGAKLGKRKKNRPAGGKRPKMSLEDY